MIIVVWWRFYSFLQRKKLIAGDVNNPLIPVHFTSV